MDLDPNDVCLWGWWRQRGWKNQKRRLDSASLWFFRWGNWEPKTARQWVRAPDQTLVLCLLVQCIAYYPQKNAPPKSWLLIYRYWKIRSLEAGARTLLLLFSRSFRLFATPWTAARQASLSFTNSWSLLKLISIELVRSSNHLILCRPFLLLPSIFLSIRVFSNELALRLRWPKYWSFSFSISPSNEYSGLISFCLCNS